MDDFEFIGPNDKPALLAITSPAPLQVARAALTQIGFKTHVASSHDVFATHYSQVNYQLVIIEETFAGANLLENPSLQFVQALPMSQRRYAVFFLIGPSLESLNTMQAFSQSVHCVLNFGELPMLSEVVQKTLGENDMFLSTFREVQRRVYQKGN